MGRTQNKANKHRYRELHSKRVSFRVTGFASFPGLLSRCVCVPVCTPRLIHGRGIFALSGDRGFFRGEGRGTQVCDEIKFCISHGTHGKARLFEEGHVRKGAPRSRVTAQLIQVHRSRKIAFVLNIHLEKKEEKELLNTNKQTNKQTSEQMIKNH
jgi:hypothetical protein